MHSIAPRAFKCQVDALDDMLCTPLYCACLEGKLDCAKSLLEAQADANIAATDGCTPLFVACHCGFYECVNLLLSAGAVVDKLSVDNASPLHIAAQNGEELHSIPPSHHISRILPCRFCRLCGGARCCGS